ncbi:phospho-N-acetylmuramoyl-pentapeptide-transferase [Nakamurella endophytica]|uniref:Phospho-N-acetylmuramoyl-pentapeptide-transferase n=1 Tax=Nakamurella endophytica TaxID=1748367 RepID=A0A917WKT5_9ACTN|nr:phospho-N-acetylmuramoyl-pentapeptide-transferase [Nakamurella endophytica]GGM11560.1 phospho-N-acetylmuramoyl-pentapeptide-transferase [Nakamurella endophytica]
MKSILVAAVVGLVVSILLTPYLIKVFSRQGFGQEIRDDGPKTHLGKRGTPTMGGTAIVIAMWAGYAAAIAVQLFTGGIGPTLSGILLLYLTTGLGVVGMLDDWIKIRKQRSLGLGKRAKLIGQTFVAVSFGVLALLGRTTAYQRSDGTTSPGLTPASTALSYTRDLRFLSFGAVGFVILAVLLIAAWSNAVNFTDGLDGLAAGTTVMALGTYVFIGFYQFRNACWNPDLSGAALGGCYEVRDPLDIAVVAAGALGGCIGFLWWNAHPARIFMGDSGSLALGGLVAGLSILTRTELLMVVVAGLAVVEMLSVVLQMLVYKARKVRVFKMAPFHHHFEVGGWTETTVMVRFWLLAAMSAALGAGLFYADWLARTGG